MRVIKVINFLDKLNGNEYNWSTDEGNEPFIVEYTKILDVEEDLPPPEARAGALSSVPLTEIEDILFNLRLLANYAFLKNEYDFALKLYNIAIELSKHSWVLFNSRALCHIRLNSMRRAIIDCDYVINKLDEKNLNAWLFRAKSYRKLDATFEFDKSVAEAKKGHPKQMDYIENILTLIQTDAATY